MAGDEFDLEQVRAGQLTPMFFGSAMNNFGVESFLAKFLEYSVPPQPPRGRGGRRDRPGQPRFFRLHLQDTGQHEPRAP